MNSLLKREAAFLRLLLHTNARQQRALLKTIQSSQLQAIVQVVYNVLMGMRELKPKDKQRLKQHKQIIRRFVSKDISSQRRKQILLHYFPYLKIALELVSKEI